jgi:hypothetical protein
MSNSKPSNDEHRPTFVEEIYRQVSTQSALLAGFAFAGLTSVSYDAATPWGLTTAFGVCASVSITLELLALFTSGILIFASKAISLEDKFESEMMIAWLSYLGGLLTFLAALALIAWIKVRPAAIPITGIAILAAIAMFVIMYRASQREP